MRARYPSLQVRSDNEEALKHVLRAACEQVHLELSNTWLETPASDGRGEHTVRAMKEMVQRHKESVHAMGITFSIEHRAFPLIVRHSEWMLNHLVRNDFMARHVTKITLETLFQGRGNCSIVFWQVDVRMTTNSHDFSQLGFWVLLEAQWK